MLIKDRPQSSWQREYGQLFKSLLHWASRQPSALFLLEAESGQKLTYEQALAAVDTFQRVLGEEPRRIALMLPGGIINAVCWLSVLNGGHHLIPLSPAATAREKAAIGRRYQPDVLIVEQEVDADGFGCPGAMVLTRCQCEALLARASYVALVETQEGSVHLTTSGSTGKPKGVVLREQQIAWSATQVCESHQLTPSDRGLTVLPFFHINAPVVSLCASLLAGSSLVIARRFSSSQFWSWIELYQITWASVVPTIVAMLLETEKPAFLSGSLRFLRTGSAALPAANLSAFEDRFGIPLIETYGLSEAASQIVANPLPPAVHKPGSAGKATGVALRICSVLTETGMSVLRDVPAGEVGEICIAGPGVIEAYEDNEGPAAFQDGWFRTGDLGYLDRDGYLFIQGRLREVINRGGENIAPREIEEVLQNYPAVREAAVVGRPDAIYGEQVVAYLTVRTLWDETGAEQLQRYLAQHLAAPKIPVELIVLEQLPRNATGKIDRYTLRARERARFAEKMDIYKQKTSS